MIDPKRLSELHRRAMQLSHDAEKSADKKVSSRLTREAFEAEREAAEMLRGALEEEPGRSVLFRSAAVLALECGNRAEAERLAHTGLQGSPPASVAAELREVLERAKQRQ
jgi:hypothetical protein